MLVPHRGVGVGIGKAAVGVLTLLQAATSIAHPIPATVCRVTNRPFNTAPDLACTDIKIYRAV